MSAGKGFSIAGGVLILIATYALAWYTLDVGGTTYLAYGVNGIGGLANMFVHPEAYGTAVGMEPAVTFVFAGIFIWFLVSGVLALIGGKVRGFSFAGAVMPIVIATIIILAPYGGPTTIPMDYITVFESPIYLVTNIIPFTIQIGSVQLSIGLYVLLLGGFFTLISGFMKRKKNKK